jgi:glycosyltransferase involved in cell wall biosynthesis
MASEPSTAHRPLSILHVLEKNRFNTGSVHQMFQAAQGLQERGHRVAIVSRPGTEIADRCRAVGLELVPLALHNELDVFSGWRLARILREHAVDVVHTHKGIAHSVALWASIRQPIPCFVANRGVSFPIDVWMRPKFRTPRLHRVVTVCEDIRQVIIRTGKLPPKRVTVVYAGVDLRRFDPDRVDGSAIRGELGLACDAFVVSQIGVRPWRGWRYLVEAMAEVVRVNPKAHLLLVACKDQAAIAEVRALAAYHGVERSVTPIGFRHDVPEISAALDLAVDLSYAGLGITGTLREAMAMRKPVVCTNAGGNPELVLDGVTGRLVKPQSAASAAAGIIEVMQDPAKARSWGLAGRTRVEGSFSMDVRIRQLEELYLQILAPCQLPPP